MPKQDQQKIQRKKSDAELLAFLDLSDSIVVFETHFKNPSTGLPLNEVATAGMLKVLVREIENNPKLKSKILHYWKIMENNDFEPPNNNEWVELLNAYDPVMTKLFGDFGRGVAGTQLLNASKRIIYINNRK
jgi:hypothetical protein